MDVMGAQRSGDGAAGGNDLPPRLTTDLGARPVMGPVGRFEGGERGMHRDLALALTRPVEIGPDIGHGDASDG